MDPSDPPPETPPAGPPEVPPVYAPPMPYYYPPPQQGSSNPVLIVVVVVVVILAVSIALPAILYFMVSGLLTTGGPPSPPRPIMTLTAPSVQGDNVTFSVAGASEVHSASIYRANLLVNSSFGTSRTLAPSFAITVAGDPYQVTYTDADGSGTLNVGDQFRVLHTGGFDPATSYEFLLLWSDGALVSTVRW